MNDVASLVQELIDAGASPAVAASVVTRAFLAGAQDAPPRRDSRQDRNARWYEAHRDELKQRRLKASENRLNSLNASETTESKGPDKEIPRTPKEITPNQEPTSLRSVGPTDENSRKKEARASRLPAAWTLPVDWRDWTIGEGMLAAEIDRQAIRFRDFWIAKAGKDAAKQDWQATWRNWIRRALDDRPSLRSGPAPMTASHDTMAPVAFDSPAYKPLLTRYRHEHGGADPPMNGKAAMLPADWVQASNEAVRRMQQ